jgi:uncharacterized protein YdeI (YjbR/CyaY-like superfamily)
MELKKTLNVQDKEDWHSWLVKNHNKEKEIWLIYYKKSSGKPRISYNDAVDEALCFGWIDSTVKSIDNEKYAQRFTPRRSNSLLSQMNLERVRKLISEKRMTKFGLDAISHAFDLKTDAPNDFIIEADILKEIKSNKEAWANFQNLPDNYKRIRIAYIGHRREQSKEEFEKRLNYFIKMTAKNKRFGMIK